MNECNQNIHASQNLQTMNLSHIYPYQTSIDEDQQYVETELQNTPIKMESRNCYSIIDSETSLWIAVLKQAVEDARLLSQTARRRPDLKRNSAFCCEVENLKNYFTHPSSDTGGFGFICSLIDADSQKLGEIIMKKYFHGLNLEHVSV